MRGRIGGRDTFHGPGNASSRLTKHSFNHAPAISAGENGGSGMKSMMRIFRSAGMIATLAAALAVSACASKPGDNSMASAGAATPGSEQDFVVNVGDRVFFESDSSELTSTSRVTLDKQAQ